MSEPCTCTISCIPQGITEDQECKLKYPFPRYAFRLDVTPMGPQVGKDPPKEGLDGG